MNSSKKIIPALLALVIAGAMLSGSLFRNVTTHMITRVGSACPYSIHGFMVEFLIFLVVCVPVVIGITVVWRKNSKVQ